MAIAMVVGGGGFQGLPVLRGLHAIGWRALIADSVQESLNQFEADVFACISEARYYDKFRTDMIGLVERHSVEAVFPTTMYDLPALAKLRPQLEELGVRVFASDPELVDLLSDKARTMLAALEAGLPVLPIIDPSNFDFSSPLIGKPARGWGGIDIFKVATKEEWQDAVVNGAVEGYLWQRELTNFCEWSVDFALRADGACSTRVSRRRLRTTGGFSVISEVTETTAVDSLASQVATWLATKHACGLFNIQFLEEPDGSLWLNDLNPRPGTSSVCALASGVNLIDFLLHKDCEHKPSRPGFVIRTLTERFLPQLGQQIKGVVFDLDETLICQKTWMQDKLEIVLAKSQGSIEPLQLGSFRLEALRLIDEGPWHQLIDFALERSRCPLSLANILIPLWRSAHPETIFLHEDARSFLQALRARNIPVALLTDNPAASQRQKISRLLREIQLQFESIVLTDELSLPKPDVTGFLAAANSLSLAPENLLMVGDSPWRDGLGAIQSGYAGALLVKRDGSMSNPLHRLFEKGYPQMASRIVWTNSLYGVDRMLGLQ